MNFQHVGQQHDISLLFTKFTEMLDSDLAQTAARITSDIKHDLHLLGSHLETFETQVDATIDRVNQNTDRFQELQDQLEGAMAKINDLENRLRRLNFRIRGLPEIPSQIHQKRYNLSNGNLIGLIGPCSPPILMDYQVT